MMPSFHAAIRRFEKTSAVNTDAKLRRLIEALVVPRGTRLFTVATIEVPAMNEKLSCFINEI